MLRIIGILIGSALAIGLIIVTLGLPTLTPPSSGSVTELPGSGSVTDLEEIPQVIETAASGAPDIPHPAEGAVPEPDGLETDPELDPEQLVEQIFSPVPQPEPASEPEPDPEPAIEENWYAFWSPFRSELAANGFVSRLQETTGIDYRVVKIKTGVYEVAFAYTDDADVQDKLSRIAAATGLDMSGG
jgi:hypothetical protein